MQELIQAGWKRYREEKLLWFVGGLGLVLGGVCTAARLFHGPLVAPEGYLMKAATFDGAVGLFIITLALILPLASYSRRKRALWRWVLAGLTVFGYGVETIQVFRGLNPRFTQAGAVSDQILGGVFFLSAVGIMVLFIILLARFFFRKTNGDDGSLVVALRYGAVLAMSGFTVGILMSAIGSPLWGDGESLLPLHAFGFHGLQVVPLVSLLAGLGGIARSETKRLTHVAGIAWSLATFGVAVQIFSGVPILAVGLGSVVALIGMLAWASVLWRALPRSSRRVNEVAV